MYERTLGAAPEIISSCVGILGRNGAVPDIIKVACLPLPALPCALPAAPLATTPPLAGAVVTCVACCAGGVVLCSFAAGSATSFPLVPPRFVPVGAIMARSSFGLSALIACVPLMQRSLELNEQAVCAIGLH